LPDTSLNHLILSGQYKRILISKMVAIHILNMFIKCKSEYLDDMAVFEWGYEETDQGLVIRPYLYQ
jgi:hypothetical protein